MSSQRQFMPFWAAILFTLVCQNSSANSCFDAFRELFGTPRLASAESVFQAFQRFQDFTNEKMKQRFGRILEVDKDWQSLAKQVLSETEKYLNAQGVKYKKIKLREFSRAIGQSFYDFHAIVILPNQANRLSQFAADLQTAETVPLLLFSPHLMALRGFSEVNTSFSGQVSTARLDFSLVIPFRSTGRKDIVFLTPRSIFNLEPDIATIHEKTHVDTDSKIVNGEEVLFAARFRDNREFNNDRRRTKSKTCICQKHET